MAVKCGSCSKLVNQLIYSTTERTLLIMADLIRLRRFISVQFFRLKKSREQHIRNANRMTMNTSSIYFEKKRELFAVTLTVLRKSLHRRWETLSYLHWRKRIAFGRTIWSPQTKGYQGPFNALISLQTAKKALDYTLSSKHLKITAQPLPSQRIAQKKAVSFAFSAIVRRMDAKPGLPYLSSGGKYVPPVTGFRSGVRNTLIGQPPPPDIACNEWKKS